LISATRTSSTQYQRLARAEAGADGGHAQHAVDQLGHRGPEALIDVRQSDSTLAYGAVDDRGHQRILIELEVGKNFGDLQACLETRGAVGP
jgi:hypothetical protein